MLALVAGGSGIRLNIQDVTGLDDQAPASPDGTSTHQSSVLSEGELLGGTGKVGDTGEDQAPLSYGNMLARALSRYMEKPSIYGGVRWRYNIRMGGSGYRWHIK